MHQPYYKNLLTGETAVPWVRLHGIKDYLDMVKLLDKYPAINLTFNLVPSLLEQIEDYTNRNIKDKYLELSYKPAASLTADEQTFIRNHFFSINKDKVISLFPRYYELYFKKQKHLEFTTQDYLDLQVLFNLAWTDPVFRQSFPELSHAVNKARYFTEDEKHAVLDKQTEILENIIPAYKEAIAGGHIEVSTTPYYHPILPLIYNTNSAREANLKSLIPKVKFSYPLDVKAQIDSAVSFYKDTFGVAPAGMWPSEESVSERILASIIQSGIKWIVTDEAILARSLKTKKRNAALIYQPHLLERKEGSTSIIFRDRNLSDLLGFVYYKCPAGDAVKDFMKHLENISAAFKDNDILVTLAMDGENAWEYYTNDGYDFLEAFYKQLSDSKFVKTTTVSEYLKTHPPKSKIKRLATGSWIFGNFDKWMNNPYKAKAWEWLAEARKELDDSHSEMAWKQMHILEGSDWFWWYGEDPDGTFDKLFRMHLSNFYTLIGKEPPAYLKRPLTP